MPNYKPQFNQNFSLITRPDDLCEEGQYKYIFDLLRMNNLTEEWLHNYFGKKRNLLMITRREASDLIQKLRRIKYGQ